MNKKNPEYDVLLPIWEKSEPWFDFDEEQCQMLIGGDPWRLGSPDRERSVHAQASSCNAVTSVHPNAMVVGGPAGTGEMTFMSIVMIFFSATFVVMGGLMLMTTGFHHLSILSLLLLVPSLFCVSFFTRLSFFKARDIPVLFNRKSRTVTVSTPRSLSFFKFWQPGIIAEMKTYSWDCIHVRSYKYMQMLGETARESYNLALLCADSDSPRTLKDFTYIGYVETWNDAPLWRLWEHIRRYMEEDGPPLQPGETLRTSGTGKLPEFPQHLIDAAGGEALSIEEIEQLTGFDHRPR